MEELEELIVCYGEYYERHLFKYPSDRNIFKEENSGQSAYLFRFPTNGAMYPLIKTVHANIDGHLRQHFLARQNNDSA